MSDQNIQAGICFHGCMFPRECGTFQEGKCHFIITETCKSCEGSGQNPSDPLGDCPDCGGYGGIIEVKK